MNLFRLYFQCHIGGVAIVTYSPLWKTLKAKGISKNHLKKNGIDGKIMARMNQGKPISLNTLEKICRIVGCRASDVVDFIDYVVVDAENTMIIERVSPAKICTEKE